MNHRRLRVSRLLAGATFVVVAALTLLPQGCSGIGAAGDRCNPNRGTDECNSGLTCSTNTCGISVCCASPFTEGSPPECRPKQDGCPEDGGAAGASGDAASD